MRQLFAVLFAGFAGLVLSAPAVVAADVEVKGAHICCGACVKAAGKALTGIDGVTNGKADLKTRLVSFNAKDEAAAKAGVKALFDSGIFGSATLDGKDLKVDAAAPKKGEKANKIVVKNVHACCQTCQTLIQGLFDGATVTFEGKGAQRTVTIAGNGLEARAVIETLRKKGFNGNIE